MSPALAALYSWGYCSILAVCCLVVRTPEHAAAELWALVISLPNSLGFKDTLGLLAVFGSALSFFLLFSLLLTT